jgi:membrane-associated phospholipid phosphatase
VEDDLRGTGQTRCRLTAWSGKLSEKTLMKRWRIALGLAGAFAALAVSVRLGLVNAMDLIIRAWARPDDVWGPAQQWSDVVVEGLRPAVLAALLAAFTIAYSVKHRSVRPLAFVAGVCLATLAITVATKITVGRLNPHGVVGNDGGSFPSGHTITVVVCLGLCVLMAQPRTSRWAWLIPAFGAGLMGGSLLLQAAHWFTDIVGGGLLATAVLAIAIASGGSRWIHDQSLDDHESVGSEREGQMLSLTSTGQADMDSRPI